MRLPAVLLVCLAVAACSASRPPGPASNANSQVEPGQSVDLEPQAARDGEEFTGSGEALEGTFVLGEATLTMTPEGEFSRIGPGGVADGGSYLVTQDNRLVLFVEWIGEVRLTTARPEVLQRSLLVPAF